MTSSTSKTGFLDLPAEIRNEIYHLALVNKSVIWLKRRRRTSPRLAHTQPKRIEHETVARKKKNTSATEVTRGPSLLHANQPTLLQANQQIRREALAIYYGANKFKAGEVQSLQLWLDELGPQIIAMLKHVRLHPSFNKLSLARIGSVTPAIAKAQKVLRAVGVRIDDGVFFAYQRGSGGESVWTNGTTVDND